MPKKRCHWYYDDGEPRQQASGHWGCSRKKCSYVHPGDPKWDEALDPGPPPNSYIAPISHDSRNSINAAPERPSSESRLAHRMSREPGEIGTSDRPSHSPALSTISLNTNEPSRTASSGLASRGATKSTPSVPPQPTSQPSSEAVSASANMEKEPSRSEKMNVWVDRIKQLTSAVTLRTELLETERDIDKYHQLSALWKYNDMPGSARSNYRAKVDALQDKRSAKKQELNAIVNRLVEAQYWRVTPPTTDDLLQHRMEMQASISQLRDNVQDLYSLVRSLETKSMPPPPPPPLEPDTEEESSRPIKKRRLSEEAFLSMLPSSSSSTLVGPLLQPLDSKEVEALNDRLLELDDRVASLENDLVIHDNDILKEAEDLMTIKLEEWERKRTPPIRKGGSTGAPQAELGEGSSVVSPNISERLQTLEDGFMRTEVEVGGLIDEVVRLITGGNDVQKQMDSLKAENELLREQVARLQHDQEENRLAMAQDRAEIKALSAAVSALIAKSDEHPLPAPLPTSEQFLATAYPTILQHLQTDLQSTIVGLQEQVQEMLQRHGQQLSASVMEKLALTMRSVQSFSEWAERNNMGVPPQMNGVNGVNGYFKGCNQPGG